jgi:hypothetical protein
MEFNELINQLDNVKKMYLESKEKALLSATDEQKKGMGVIFDKLENSMSNPNIPIDMQSIVKDIQNVFLNK